MLITLHQFGFSGNTPIYIVAEDIQAINYSDVDNNPGSILTMIHGNFIAVLETPLQVLRKLQEIIPERWEGT